MDPALRGKTVRLEAPDELPGEWAGPVYATVGRETKLLAATDSGPFVAEDDGVRRPAWQAKLIIMRHDQRREDLPPALQEHVDRPLLSVFRFVRVSEFYVAMPRCDTKFTRRTSDVFVYGQVLTYQASPRLSLVDDIDVLLEPGSGYTCMFMLGYYEGLPASVEPPSFERTWSALALAGISDAHELSSRLASAFPSPGEGGPPTVDLDSRPVAYVTSRGEKAATSPLAYVRSIMDLPSPEVGDSVEAEPVLPLLTRADTMLTTSDIFDGHPRHDPDPMASVAPGAPTPGVLPSAAAVPGAAAPPTFSDPMASLLSALVEQQRTATAATQAATQALLRQVSDLTTLVHSKLHAQGSLAPVPTRDSTPQALVQDQPPRPASHACRTDHPEPHGDLIAEGLPGAFVRRGCSRSRSPRHHSNSRQHRGSTPRHRSPRQTRSRSRNRGRHQLRSRSRTRSPRPMRPRSRSRERRSRSWNRDAFRRSRSRGRSPRGHRPTGNSLFRPTDNEAAVHSISRVGPRPARSTPGMDDYFNRFLNMSPQDRVCSMFQHERFRNRYRVTKVTTKMLYSVDFSSRPLDHFLSSEEPGAYQQERTVVHDDTLWGGAEPGPPFQIRQADQLHRVLQVIQEAAAEWYPPDLAVVFRTIHGDAIHNVPQQAPTQVVHAWCNLYQAVLGELFNDVLNGEHSRDLNPRALRILSSDSREHQVYISRVLNDAVMRSVFDGATTKHRREQQPRHRRAVQARSSQTRGHRPETTVIPPDTRAQIPLVNGTQVCIRFQAASDCSFPTCRHAHVLQRLPPAVLQWVTSRHGALKSNHPQSS
ncbi:hypothetical protein PR003_g21479 [Phytophthora rubi]|uniref:Uncharacterized protein n=1 Tax=Phytophthora rubi TaxID=129364 RepID=A0A6A4DMA8_9STRA|nr:hypothetical protein PR003_g21479 [Phytophthora rubi]